MIYFVKVSFMYFLWFH